MVENSLCTRIIVLGDWVGRSISPHHVDVDRARNESRSPVQQFALEGYTLDAGGDKAIQLRSSEVHQVTVDMRYGSFEQNRLGRDMHV
jgi:hypothetical protein